MSKQAYKTLKHTNNSRVYKSALKTLTCSCTYCKPNKGCNRSYKRPINWKEYRLKQWR